VKQVLDEHDVQFRLGRAVAGIRTDARRAAVELAPDAADPRAANSKEVDVISADGVVVEEGNESLALVAQLGVRAPLLP
ncbi:amino acid dehydrogenase, partial [Burkholderia pseudomallei]